MKLFIVILAVVAVALSAKLTEEQKKLLQPHKEACMAEAGIERDALMEAKMKFKEDGVKLDHKAGCFSACMFKKLGFMDQKGNADDDMIRAMVSEQVPSDKLEIAIEKCRSIPKEDLCEQAIETLTCYKEYGALVDM